MASPQVIACSKALVEKKWNISFVESATAGRLCYEFSTVPDSGKILIGGLVCYDACLKENLLEVPHGLIETFTPESAEVTKALTINFCKYSPADICVGITGLTAPGGSETPEKPVGTMFIHIIFPHKKVSERFVFDGNPEQIVSKTIDAVASIILQEVKN